MYIHCPLIGWLMKHLPVFMSQQQPDKGYGYQVRSVIKLLDFVISLQVNDCRERIFNISKPSLRAYQVRKMIRMLVCMFPNIAGHIIEKAVTT